MDKNKKKTKKVEEKPSVTEVERVQLGVRMEKRMVKVLKALAEASDMSFGEMLEDIVNHALDGKSTFSEPKVLAIVKDFKRLYGMNYAIHDHYSFPK
jgi:predicted DNA-binding ribbon-helix-helix protein